MAGGVSLLARLTRTSSERRPRERPSAPQIDPIRTLFIANRGEIAVRVRRSAEALGIRVIVPGTGAAPAVDLLDSAAVVSAARAAGADALHPGFGFLSENADFAEAVERAGVRWVGPPPGAIRAMGDKASARRLAASLGIPIVPGYDGDDQSDPALLEAARRIAGSTGRGRSGHAILIKPAAGGGGKGMRVVDRLDPPGAFVDALETARREAAAAFGDDRLVLERFLAGPRHVEIQVLFDAHGHGVHLGERDCSLQRRHQKVFEESPSPAVDEDLRQRLGQAALTLAGSVGYRSAGTCEFLLDDDGRYHFLEMNTRLQVEHPVTELITGRDLVADQLRIAAGEPLGFDQAEADAARTSGGHAIEVRLYAEDPDAGFLPSIGRIEALRWPGADVRVDSGIEAGSVVDLRFDPMLAKVIVGGPTRTEALARLEQALAETVVLGVVTNLHFLRWLATQPIVQAGEARIDTLEQIWPPAGNAGQLGRGSERDRLAGRCRRDCNDRRRRLANERAGPNPPRIGRAGTFGRARRRRRRLTGRASTRPAPSSSTMTAGASRSGSRHRPTSIEPPARPPATRPAERSRSARRCPAASWPSTSEPARPLRPASRS